VGKLDRAFYSRDSIFVAKELLGKVLVRESGGERIAARIVETEAYMGAEDRAAHSYGGRRTPRVEVMYGEAGFAYVFMIYGMHCCFNVVTAEREIPQAVLIRAAEPLEGLERMALARVEVWQALRRADKNTASWPDQRAGKAVQRAGA